MCWASTARRSIESSRAAPSDDPKSKKTTRINRTAELSRSARSVRRQTSVSVHMVGWSASMQIEMHSANGGGRRRFRTKTGRDLSRQEPNPCSSGYDISVAPKCYTSD